jgi:thiol-disulfide isomerase/thioredoxin
MIELNSIETVKHFIKNNEMALLYISSHECSVCRELLPKIKEVLVKYPRIRSAYIHIMDIPAMAAEYSVFTIPLIILFIEGREMIRESRYISVADFEGRIERYYSLLY